MTAPARSVTWNTCPHCGKRSYPNRKTARRIARRLRAGTGRVHAYQCAATGDWHVGHVPHAIKTGRTSRKDYRP